jgi:arylsulfatase
MFTNRHLQAHRPAHSPTPSCLAIGAATALTEDKWELYDTRADFSLANDLAGQDPAKVKELQDLFMQEAVKHNVLPIDDRSVERMNAKVAGRPDLMGDRTSLTLGEGMKGMSENVFINVKNRSLTITAELDIPQGGANGVILAQGGRRTSGRPYSGKPMTSRS